MRHGFAAFCLLTSTTLMGAQGCPNNPVGLCQAEVKARCELAFRCCDDKERLENSGAVFGFAFFGGATYTNSESECYDRGIALCNIGSASLNDSVALGRLKYDAAQGQECVDALNAARDDCDINAFNEASAENGPCVDTTEGLVDDGDDCALTAECAEDSFCFIEEDPSFDSDIGAVKGECVGPAREGDDCSTRACDTGLRCVADGTGQTCVAPPGEGELCPDFFCADGLQCTFNGVTGQSTCETPPGNGDPCPDFVCAEELACTFDVGAGVNTCQPNPGIGEPCPNFVCTANAFCDQAQLPQTCAAKRADGAQCQLSNECQSEICDTTQSPPTCTTFGDLPPNVELDICKGK